MQLQLATWPEVEAYLETSRGIIVPIGSTEQHGPTGLIGTDALTAEFIGRRLGEEIGVLVAPTISVGMAQHHMDFTGSITFRPSTLIMVVRDIVVSLARHRFDHFFFVNGHGGNIAPVSAAFSEIHAELAEAAAMRGAGANKMPAEVFCSLANWYAYPEQQRDAPLGDIAPAERPFQGATDYRRLYPDGRIGADPSLSTPEDGEKLVAAAVKDLSETYRKFLEAGPT